MDLSFDFPDGGRGDGAQFGVGHDGTGLVIDRERLVILEVDLSKAVERPVVLGAVFGPVCRVLVQEERA